MIRNSLLARGCDLVLGLRIGGSSGPETSPLLVSLPFLLEAPLEGEDEAGPEARSFSIRVTCCPKIIWRFSLEATGS